MSGISKREGKAGRPRSGRTPSKKVLLRLYVREGKSIREIGETLNCSKDMVARALKEYGIEARANVKRSQLRDIPRDKLVSQVSEKGRGYFPIFSEIS